MVLCFFAGLFALLHTLLQVFIDRFNASITSAESGWALFNMNAEISMPTWYAQMFLFFAATIVFLIANAAVEYKKYWLCLAFIFVFLSIDKGASIHELLTNPLRDLLAATSGPLFYTWVVSYLAVVGLAGLFFLLFFSTLPRKTKLLGFASVTLFLTGAIGFEVLSGIIASKSGEAGLLYSILVAIEELLEMLGAVLFIYTLLDYIRTQQIEFSLVTKILN